jgi:hypothetical protein
MQSYREICVRAQEIVSCHVIISKHDWCRPQDRRRAKYELMHTERTLITSNAAYNCIKVRQAADGEAGCFLHKDDVLASASESLKLTLTKLAPRILPLSELVRYLQAPCSHALIFLQF